MKINFARIGSRISRKVPRIRILRSWRGYPVGAVIQPPGAARQILLQAKDQLGNKIAELVEDPPEPIVAETEGAPTEHRTASAKKKKADMAEMKEAGVDDERKDEK